jgi:protein SCO1/2
MKSVRIALWAAVVVAAGIATWLALGKGTDLASARLGTNFELMTDEGGKITEKDLEGRPYLIYFGFTHCPEICPTTLAETSAWLERLGDKGGDLRVYFVTVDPERDTQEILESYLSSFDDRIIGITGDLPEIDRLAKSFHIYYRKVPLDDGDYTMDHTASVFLMRPDGTFQGTIAFGEDSDIAYGKIEKLLAGDS